MNTRLVANIALSAILIGAGVAPRAYGQQTPAEGLGAILRIAGPLELFFINPEARLSSKRQLPAAVADVSAGTEHWFVACRNGRAYGFSLEGVPLWDELVPNARRDQSTNAVWGLPCFTPDCISPPRGRSSQLEGNRNATTTRPRVSVFGPIHSLHHHAWTVESPSQTSPLAKTGFPGWVYLGRHRRIAFGPATRVCVWMRS